MFVRFDYEGLDPRAAFYLMRDLEAVILDKAFTSQKFAVGDHIYSVERADNFEYIDPVDGTVARNQVSLDILCLDFFLDHLYFLHISKYVRFTNMWCEPYYTEVDSFILATWMKIYWSQMYSYICQ